MPVTRGSQRVASCFDVIIDKRLSSMDGQTAQCNSTSEYICGSGFALIIIPALLTGSTVVVVLLIVHSLCCRTSGHEDHGKSFHAGQGLVNIATVSAGLVTARDALGPWEVSKDCVLEGLEFLEMGRYGPVCKSRLQRRGITCAVVVKTLQEGASQTEAREFFAWIHFHAKVCQHENLVHMLLCQTRRLPMFLVLDASVPGNLLYFLWTLRKGGADKGAQLRHFSERSVYLVAKQVAAGLNYLSSVHKLIHGNVAAQNILIGTGLSVRVSGLGMAFDLWHKGVVRQRLTSAVPVKWQAPERLMRLPVSERSDVWSFGIVLYELITLGSPPYPDLEPHEVLPQLQKSYRMKRPESCGGPLYDLMKYCWMWSSQDRPHFSSIIRLLDSYTHLAQTKALGSEADDMDVAEYGRMAGYL
ncbi:tyrosine-protein kinase STYK1-like [Arapaima gigas]